MRVKQTKNFRRGLEYISIFLVLGCVHAPVKPVPFEANDFWAEQGMRWEALSLVLGKITARISGKEGTHTGRGHLVTELPARLRLELRDPLGRVQLLIVSMGRELTAYYPAQKLAYIDKSWGKSYFMELLRMELSVTDLQSLFVGFLPAAKRGETWSWDSESGLYTSHLVLAGKEARVHLDPQLLCVRRVVFGGRVPLDVQFRDFQPCCTEGGRKRPLAVARHIKLTSDQGSIDVQWEDLQPFQGEKESSAFRVDLPAEVEKRVF